MLGGHDVQSLIVDPTLHRRIDQKMLPQAIQQQVEEVTHMRSEEEVRQAIEADFAQKLVNYKSQQAGQEYRLFGHTMVNFDQLHDLVSDDTCI